MRIGGLLDTGVTRLSWSVLLAAGVVLAQSYSLGPVVLAAGGRELSSSGYRCGLSVGQTLASGPISGTGYLAILGFWHRPYGAGIGEDEVWAQSQPNRVTLGPNQPNPFSDRTTLRYSLASETDVSLTVLNALGQTVATLVRSRQKPGVYRVDWNPSRASESRLPGGVYFSKLVAGDVTQIRKMVRACGSDAGPGRAQTGRAGRK